MCRWARGCTSSTLSACRPAGTRGSSTCCRRRRSGGRRCCGMRRWRSGGLRGKQHAPAHLTSPLELPISHHPHSAAANLSSGSGSCWRQACRPSSGGCWMHARHYGLHGCMAGCLRPGVTWRLPQVSVKGGSPPPAKALAVPALAAPAHTSCPDSSPAARHCEYEAARQQKRNTLQRTALAALRAAAEETAGRLAGFWLRWQVQAVLRHGLHAWRTAVAEQRSNRELSGMAAVHRERHLLSAGLAAFAGNAATAGAGCSPGPSQQPHGSQGRGGQPLPVRYEPSFMPARRQPAGPQQQQQQRQQAPPSTRATIVIRHRLSAGQQEQRPPAAPAASGSSSCASHSMPDWRAAADYWRRRHETLAQQQQQAAPAPSVVPVGTHTAITLQELRQQWQQRPQ